MQSAQCRRVQGPLSRLALQGLLQHIQLALCHYEPPHGFDNLQNHHAITWAKSTSFRHFNRTAGLSCDARRVIFWIELSSLKVQVFTENRKNTG